MCKGEIDRYKQMERSLDRYIDKWVGRQIDIYICTYIYDNNTLTLHLNFLKPMLFMYMILNGKQVIC